MEGELSVGVRRGVGVEEIPDGIREVLLRLQGGPRTHEGNVERHVRVTGYVIERGRFEDPCRRRVNNKSECEL